MMLGTTEIPQLKPLSDSELAQNQRLLAIGKLPFRRPNLSPRQSATQRTPQTRTRQTQTPRTLGHHSRPQLHLRSPQPPHQIPRLKRYLHRRPGTRRAGLGGQHLSRRNLYRILLEHFPR